jgi:hypothetical protein
MREVIERAVGRNDEYPNEFQLMAHRAKQELHEKHFNNQPLTKHAQ